MMARSEQDAASAEAHTSKISPERMPGDTPQADAPPDTEPGASGDALDRQQAPQLAEPAQALVAQAGLPPTAGQAGMLARPTGPSARARALADDGPIGGIPPDQGAATSNPEVDGAGPVALAPVFDPSTIALDEPTQSWAAPLAHELSALLAEGAPRSARLKLHPPTLGDIALAVDLQADSVRATLTVATPAAHAMLTAGLGLLADSMLASGLRLDSLHVALGDTGAGAGRHDDAKSPRNGPAEPSFATSARDSTVLDGSSVPSPTPTHQGRVHVYA